MRTRLLSERLVQERFPHLRYVRIHTDGVNKATIYAWDEGLQLTDKDLRGLKQFAADYLSPYVCFKVKPYHHVQTDQVEQVQELPQPLIKAALNRSLNQHGIIELMSRLFACGRLAFNKYDTASGILRFDFHSSAPVSPREKESISVYLNEMIPIGLKAEVDFD